MKKSKSLFFSSIALGAAICLLGAVVVGIHQVRTNKFLQAYADAAAKLQVQNIKMYSGNIVVPWLPWRPIELIEPKWSVENINSVVTAKKMALNGWSENQFRITATGITYIAPQEGQAALDGEFENIDLVIDLKVEGKTVTINSFEVKVPGYGNFSTSAKLGNFSLGEDWAGSQVAYLSATFTDLGILAKYIDGERETISEQYKMTAAQMAQSFGNEPKQWPIQMQYQLAVLALASQPGLTSITLNANPAEPFSVKELLKSPPDEGGENGRYGVTIFAN